MIINQQQTPAQNVLFADSPSNDAFGRIRVSNPTTLMDTVFQYGLNPLYWQSSTAVGGSIIHSPNDSGVILSGTTASGSTAIRQTFEYYRYQPGRSQQILMTGVMGAKKTNVRQRIGLFDISNGLFFEQDVNNLKVVRRTKTSGVVVDNPINQSAWNIDRLDGSGSVYNKSGILIDMSKTQIFVIDFEWLGVGRVRFGFNINGITYYCHQMTHANILTTVYMQTANLPIRYEIQNTAATATPTRMLQICSVVTSGGGEREQYGLIHSVNNGISPISVTTRRAVISARPKATFNSIVNRGLIILESYSIYSAADVFFEIVYNGTLGGSPSWTSAGTNSLVEFDVAGTTVTGGEILDSGYVPSSGGGLIVLTKNISNKLPLSLDINGANPTNISIVVTSIGGSANSWGAINVREIY
jgi:hypothetical protein